MKNMIKLCIVMTLFIWPLFGCSQSEIEYFSNPHILISQGTDDIAVIDDYQLSIIEDILIINGRNKEFGFSLPDNFSSIQSFHFSYDKRFLAYDIAVENGNQIFVVNLETGEKLNLSETIGYLYDYDGYETPYGIAWAPNKNIIAFIGGYNDSARINIYHLELDKEKQVPTGSLIFEDIYGVKWDSTGESIYYLVDSLEDENMYQIYQTELETNSHLVAGTLHMVAEINQKSFKSWLNKEE